MRRNQSLPIMIWGVFLLLSLAITPHLLAQESTDQADPAPKPRPFPVTTVMQDGITAQLYFEELQQGRVGLVYVSGPNLNGVQAIFFNRQIDFFQAEDGWYGLVVANMDMNARSYPLNISAINGSGESIPLSLDVEVSLGGFVRQDFNLPADRAYLIEPEVERNEFARLDSIMQNSVSERLWTDAGFQYPVDGELTAPFGAFRTINQTIQTRHTGWDFRATTGTPVMTMAAGKVAFAGRLDIRGNYVMIDHGMGIYSGYAHFSQIHVTRGQSIVDGQIIGISGNTGRSSGPHVHWEIAVQGQWVDSVDFVETWLPD